MPTRALLAAALLAGCAPMCPVGDRADRVELLMGLERPDGSRISDAEWAAFLGEAATPRFPDGLTVLEAAGQWRDAATGRTVRERSRILLIVTKPARRPDVEAVAAAYKRRFAQDSVGIVTTPACANW